MHRGTVVFGRNALAPVAIALLAVACGGSTTTTSELATAPDPVRCQTSVANQPATVPYAGSNVTLTVVAGRECSWTANSGATWARISPAAGQGEMPVTVTVSANADAQSRTTSLVFNDARVNLTQDPAPCRYNLGSSESRMSSEAGRTAVQLSTPAACAWRVTGGTEWVRAVNASGTGDASIQFEASSNTGPARTATFTIADQSFRIIQEDRRAPAPGPAPGPSPGPAPACSIAIDPGSRSFPASGGEGSVRVTAAPGCAWSATASHSWVDISGSSGTGNDTIRYRVSANTSTSARSASISVGGRTHNIQQEAAPAPPPSGGGDDDDDDDKEERVNLNGIALFVDGSCPSVSFFVGLRRVFTNGDTRWRGDRCSGLRNGVGVRVEGRQQSDGLVRATEVDVR
jgi:hypothetical protein